jgi:hypothetical protein
MYPVDVPRDANRAWGLLPFRWPRVWMLTDHDAVLAAYDAVRPWVPPDPLTGLRYEQRGSVLRVVGQHRGFIDTARNVGAAGEALDALIIEQRDFFAQRGEAVEWKTRGSLDDDYQVAILPTAGSVDRRRGPMNGRPGSHGADGAPGLPGTRPSGVPTMIGFALRQPVGDRLDGTAGTDGGNGHRGEDGRTGGATKTAEITVGRLTGTLAVLAIGGCGGQGGRGGDGGHGGDGGEAVPGFRTPTGPVPDGQPGRGGYGGDGGDGGRAGHGGISSNVFITVPDAAEARVHVRTAPGEGGDGGPGGNPGRAGRGGTNGATVAARGAGAAGSASTARAAGAAANGNDDSAGRAGRAGRARPAPEVFVNGRPSTAREPHT